MSAVIKNKKCKAPDCETTFTPYSTLTRACSLECALILVKIAKEKKQRKDTRERKVAIRTLSDWLKLAQPEFNRFTRIRDKDDPCISCGKFDHELKDFLRGGKWDAGHFKAIGSHPELRFNEDNCHKQCKKCNNQRSGNISNYRINLVNKIGLDRVVELEGHHEPKHYIIDDIKEIREIYRLKAKELEGL